MSAQSLPEASPGEATALAAPLPEIPNKRYFTIGEVSELCAVKAHVLRYWEQEFSQLKPTKRRGNRRYYQRHDIDLIRRIRTLLYEQGFTIAGARQQLNQPDEPALPRPQAPLLTQAPAISPATPANVVPKRTPNVELALLREQIEALLAYLRG